MTDVVRPRLCQVVLDSTDARRSAEFRRALLGLVYRPGQEPPPPGADDRVGSPGPPAPRPDDPEEPLYV